MYNFNNTRMCSTYIYVEHMHILLKLYIYLLDISTYLVIQFLQLNFLQHFQHIQSLVQYLFQFLFQNFVSHHQCFEEYLYLFTFHNIFQIISSNKN